MQTIMYRTDHEKGKCVAFDLCMQCALTLMLPVEANHGMCVTAFSCMGTGDIMYNFR